MKDALQKCQNQTEVYSKMKHDLEIQKKKGLDLYNEDIKNNEVEFKSNYNIINLFYNFYLLINRINKIIREKY